MCVTLPESLNPGLSLSVLQLLPASAESDSALVGSFCHDNDADGDDGDDVRVSCVHSANTTPVLDGRWDERVKVRQQKEWIHLES